MLEVDRLTVDSVNSVLDSADLWYHQRMRQWSDISQTFCVLHHTDHYCFVNKSLDYIENCKNGSKFKNAQFLFSINIFWNITGKGHICMINGRTSISVNVEATREPWYMCDAFMYFSYKYFIQWHVILDSLMMEFDSVVKVFNTGRDKMSTISQTTFSSAFSRMKIFAFRLRFHWSLFPRVQLIISQHCCR